MEERMTRCRTKANALSFAFTLVSSATTLWIFDTFFVTTEAAFTSVYPSCVARGDLAFTGPVDVKRLAIWTGFDGCSPIAPNDIPTHRRGLTRWPFVSGLFASSSSTDPNVAEDVSFLDSDDPFRVLQINSPTADAAEIRKAYRRMAIRFHPDVTTNKDSTADEKKVANDRFAKINWAYQTLSGKDSGSSPFSSSDSKSQSSTYSKSGGWTPPHRRSQSYSRASSQSTNGGRSADWRDYIPNYGNRDGEEDYSSNGDSFEAIFADLFKAAGAGVVGGGGVLRDFVEFLENEAGSTVSGFAASGFSSSSPTSLDDELRELLRTGTLEQIGEEMDDAVLVEQQLETKLSNLQQDIISLSADLKFATGLNEKMSLQEELASVQARVSVVQEYLKKARKRLLALRTRYKDLIARGQNDFKAGGGSRTRSSSRSTVWKDATERTPNDDFSRRSSSEQQPGASRSRAETNTSTRTSSAGDKNDEDAWKSDSFGSFGRGRGRGSSSRRRTGRASTSQSTTTNDSRTQSYSSSSSSSESTRPPSSSTTSSRSRSSAQSSPSQSSTSQVPPHRRTYTSYSDDKRRLREIKVDEEFDKLKKELGIE